MAAHLVLAGPILRRCDATEATVWIALRQPKRATLRVYPVAGAAVGAVPMLVGSADTCQVGANLHVVAVRAVPGNSGAALQWGQLFGYQMSFGDHGSAGDVPETGTNLESPGVLGRGIDAIVYPPFRLPTYALFPSDIGGLRIVHGSCRKVHGEGIDALPAIDFLIRDNADKPLQRPHLLLMTGDQIYADDVSDSLLHHITKSLLVEYMWNESLPEVEDSSPQLLPGRRGTIAEDLAGLTAGEDTSKSHLLRFGEFMLMYLLAWSPELWPTDLPTFADVYPELDADFRGRSRIASDDWTGHETRDPVLRRLIRQKQAFEKERASTRAFFLTLPSVRRLLANVPTLMMMDDHEITDDWYLNYGWCVRVLGKPLGMRVVQNGLAAFAVCQAWGNTPVAFEGDGNGAGILSLISNWATSQKDRKSRRKNLVHCWEFLRRLTWLKPAACVVHGWDGITASRDPSSSCWCLTRERGARLSGEPKRPMTTRRGCSAHFRWTSRSRTPHCTRTQSC